MGKHPTAGASRQTALASDEVRKVDAWRASNYLSIGVIYLLGNPPPIHLCHPGGRASWDQRTAAMSPVVAVSFRRSHTIERHLQSILTDCVSAEYTVAHRRIRLRRSNSFVLPQSIAASR